MPETTSGRPISYLPSTAGHDVGRYDLTTPNSFRDDEVATATLDDLPALAASASWEDRVRAELLRQESKVYLPDQFPCIYETADSPTKANHKHKVASAWVISPDMDMLIELLEDYQELWDSYTSQWGPSSQRTFAVGRLDRLTPHGLYRPGTTPEQVIGATMLTHTDMYRRAPQRLRRMHPMHDTWHPATPTTPVAAAAATD